MTQTQEGILSGNATLRFPENVDVTSDAVEFFRGVRLSEGLRQGRSYVVHAVVEDANSPSPNRRTRFCSAAPDSIAPGGEYSAARGGFMCLITPKQDTVAVPSCLVSMIVFPGVFCPYYCASVCQSTSSACFSGSMY